MSEDEAILFVITAVAVGWALLYAWAALLIHYLGSTRIAFLIYSFGCILTIFTAYAIVSSVT